MSKHTPGPWDLDEGDLSTVYELETSDPLAEVFSDKSAEENVANARLIAAAPELLEALEALLAASEKHIFSTECKRERDAARAAIAKAQDRA